MTIEQQINQLYTKIDQYTSIIETINYMGPEVLTNGTHYFELTTGNFVTKKNAKKVNEADCVQVTITNNKSENSIKSFQLQIRQIEDEIRTLLVKQLLLDSRKI